MIDRPSSVNADGIFEPFPTTDVPWEVPSQRHRFGIRYRQVGDCGGGTHIRVGIELRRQACPVQYHMREEDHLRILAGRLASLP